MNNTTELKRLEELKKQVKTLKELKQQSINAFDKHIGSIEAEINKDNKWKDGYYWSHCGKAEYFDFEPNKSNIETGQVFTSAENCKKFNEYQKALVRLRNACKPHLTDDAKKACIPTCGSHYGYGASGNIEVVLSAPKYLWVGNPITAHQIGIKHREDLKIIQNFTWEE